MLGEDIRQIGYCTHHRNALNLKHSFGRIVIEAGHRYATGAWLADFSQNHLSGNAGADNRDALRMRVLMDGVEERAGGKAHAREKGDGEQGLQEIDRARKRGEVKRPANGDKEGG